MQEFLFLNELKLNKIHLEDVLKVQDKASFSINCIPACKTETHFYWFYSVM